VTDDHTSNGGSSCANVDVVVTAQAVAASPTAASPPTIAATLTHSKPQLSVEMELLARLLAMLVWQPGPLLVGTKAGDATVPRAEDV
jgi:hypothetical protein